MTLQPGPCGSGLGCWKDGASGCAGRATSTTFDPSFQHLESGLDMSNRKGATVAGGCPWCGDTTHEGDACPMTGGDDTGGLLPAGSTAAGVVVGKATKVHEWPVVHRLTDAERATVYGIVGRLARRRNESGFDDEIPLHKRVMICGVTPDALERACDPGAGGGVDAATLRTIRDVLGRVKVA